MSGTPRTGLWQTSYGSKMVCSLSTGTSSRTVLDDVPVLSEQTIFDPYDVCHNPVRGVPDIPESTVQHHVIAVGGDQRVLVAHVGRCGFDKSEETLAPRFDVRAVLDVVR